MSKKVAVVTGANKGIGLAIVRELCKAKFSREVILTARNEKLGNEAVKMLKSEGFEVAYHHLDICDQGSAKQLSNFLQKSYGGLDVLINNAGMAFKNDATEPFGEQAEVTMRTNFLGHAGCGCAMLSYPSSDQMPEWFRDTELSEEELCLLMGEFVIAAQQGNHQAN
ncbi:unnamed protein product, partial [Coregonus sp. 'balchen']